MGNNVWFIVGIGIALLFYFVVSFIVSKKVKNANDYYVAGRQAPTILITGFLEPVHSQAIWALLIWVCLLLCC